MAALVGMKEIQKCVNMSEDTVLTWIRQVGFPAKKVGGIWISETEAITRWCAGIAEGVSPPEKPSDPLPLPQKKNEKRRVKRI
jgi:hypothetical protein